MLIGLGKPAPCIISRIIRMSLEKANTIEQAAVQHHPVPATKLQQISISTAYSAETQRWNDELRWLSILVLR